MSYCSICIVEGLLWGTAKVALAGNKVLRNDLAAPHSGVVAAGSRDLISALYRSKAYK